MACIQDSYVRKNSGYDLGKLPGTSTTLFDYKPMDYGFSSGMSVRSFNPYKNKAYKSIYQ